MKRSIFCDSALHVLKGALCKTFGINCGRTTKSVKFKKELTGSITVGPIESTPTEEQRCSLQAFVDDKVRDDSKFRSFIVPRDIAEKVYGQEFYDDFGLPTSIQQIRLVTLEEWNINANMYPILLSTGLLGSVRISKLKYNEGKKVLEVEFTVTPNFQLIEEISEDLICKDEQVTEEMLPSRNQVLPRLDTSTYVEDGSSIKQTITPWNVDAGDEGINYAALIKHFGCYNMTDELIERFGRITKKPPHHLLRRKIFVSHRDFDLALQEYENGTPFYLYTGRGPSSSSLHIGHLIPFVFTRYLQQALNIPVIIQLTDDEKYLFKDDVGAVEDFRSLAFENAKDIIACGFDKDKTFIFRDTDYIKDMYGLVLSIQKRVTLNQSKAIFGFSGSDNIGKISFSAIQAAPSFPACFPHVLKNYQSARCLIPQGIDQDPYFRMTRDVSPRLGFKKPALIHSIFMPALQGFRTKMSGSRKISAIFVTDTPEEIASKIMTHAFSGGKATAAEQRQKGANLDIDVSYQYLKFLVEDDDELDEIARKYKSGEMLTSEIKMVLVAKLTKIVKEHQEKRQMVSDDLVEYFMNPNRSPFL